MQEIGKVHRLYVAAPEGEVAEIVAAHFENFTTYSENGHFRGKSESMVIIEIATHDSAKVIALGERLRTHFEQDGVGYVVDGFYYRITQPRDLGRIESLPT